jgi:hypothetical protein
MVLYASKEELWSLKLRDLIQFYNAGIAWQSFSRNAICEIIWEYTRAINLSSASIARNLLDRRPSYLNMKEYTLEKRINNSQISRESKIIIRKKTIHFIKMRYLNYIILNLL